MFYFTTDFHLKKTILHTKAYKKHIPFFLSFDFKTFCFAKISFLYFLVIPVLDLPPRLMEYITPSFKSF